MAERQNIRTLPLLPEDYPLFDWADWPKSEAALVPGGPTKAFEKACWNAIIDAIADAKAGAGLRLHLESADGLKVNDLKFLNDGYGRMSAELFNTVRECIDYLIPFNWRWAIDVNYRGYLEWKRNHFRTKSIHNNGKLTIKADAVYPEYIFELVRRTNLMIQILKNTAPLMPILASYQTGSISGAAMRVGRSVPVERMVMIPLLVSPAPMRVCMGLPAHYRMVLHSSIFSNLHLRESAPICSHVHICQPIKSVGAVLQSRSVETNGLQLVSGISVELEKLMMAEMVSMPISETESYATMGKASRVAMECGNLTLSNLKVSVLERPALETVCNVQSYMKAAAAIAKLPSIHGSASTMFFSNAEAVLAQVCSVDAKGCKQRSATWITSSGVALPSKPFGRSVLIGSAEGVTSRKAISYPFVGTVGVATNSQISTAKAKSYPAWAENRSGCLSDATMEQALPANVKSDSRSTVKAFCIIGSAWDPPVWQNGGLWIQQANRIKRKPDGTLDLSGTYDPISAALHSSTTIFCTVDTAWLPPAWHNGGLVIRQCRNIKVLDYGSLDLTGAGNELGVAHVSKSVISCKLDTAWYPPVIVNGGLYVQQIQEAVQYETNELEVR